MIILRFPSPFRESPGTDREKYGYTQFVLGGLQNGDHPPSRRSILTSLRDWSGGPPGYWNTRPAFPGFPPRDEAEPSFSRLRGRLQDSQLPLRAGGADQLPRIQLRPLRGDVAQARTRSAALQLTQCRAEELGYPANSFDPVFTIDVIRPIEDPEKNYPEAYQVLKPGGRLWSITESPELIARRKPLACSRFPRICGATRPPPACANGCVSQTSKG